jgi:hypothetical protein
MSDRTRYRAERKPRKCPACGSADVVPILYGMPTAEGFKDAEAGLIALGGCCISNDDPSWACRTCNTDIYRLESHRQGAGDHDL